MMQMPTKKLTVDLSEKSLNNLIKEIQKYGTNLDKGIKIGVEEITHMLYQSILSKMAQYNLQDHESEVHENYDEKTEIGKVYTNDIVVIFHEFGTGIKGTQDEWASSFDYNVNQSGKGEIGWGFYNEKHGYGGITHGLTTKHIFYESLLEIQKEVPKTIGFTIAKNTGAMY